MSDTIYLLNEDGLHPMQNQSYGTEDDLQALLEKHPVLIPGDQINPQRPRRWLLVRREQPVPDAAGAMGRWSLDHLLLDQEGVLNLVEVKRATDTRARREVVAQMLDYAANAVTYWPLELIMESFRMTWGDEADAILEQFLSSSGEEQEPDAFWDRVKTNLEAERIRMIFVADVIPRELRRIVEFLDGQMDPARVVAVELKQYCGVAGGRTLVPQLVGQTIKATVKRSGRGGSPGEARKWDEESFFAEAAASGERISVGCKRLVDWFREHAYGVWWSKSAKVATFTTRAEVNGASRETLRVFATGQAHMSLPDEAASKELELRLNAVFANGVRRGKYFTIPVDQLADEPMWQAFVEVIRWHIAEIRRLSDGAT